jgi:thioredoxin 1
MMDVDKKYLEITDGTFENEVLNSEIPVLVDFGAEWCPPCKMMIPVIEKISEDYEGKIKVAKIDVDLNATSTLKYGIRSLPTFVIFKNGLVVDKVVGATPKKSLEEKLEQYL